MMTTKLRSRARPKARGWLRGGKHGGLTPGFNNVEGSVTVDPETGEQLAATQSGSNAQNQGNGATCSVQQEDELLPKGVGFNMTMIHNNKIYFRNVNVNADMQMYGKLLIEEDEPNKYMPSYQRKVKHYLEAFGDQISPGVAMPYCRQYDLPPRLALCKNDACSYNYDKMEKAKSEKMIYITPYQVYAICTSVMAQFLDSPDELFSDIDWEPIAKAAQLPVKLCEEFWWSFDVSHLKDGPTGFFIYADTKHHEVTKAEYFHELERRVRCLISLDIDIKEGLQTMERRDCLLQTQE